MSETGPIAATLTPAAAAARLWDALVIGAGPGGALAARELARRGAATLLVDKSEFPRGKVCGCCLNGAALAALADAGLGDLPRRLGARPLARVDLHHRGRCTTLPLPAGAALSREALDAALVREAIASGAAFLPGAAATVQPAAPRSAGRSVSVEACGARLSIATRVVIAADGLGGRSLRGEPGMDVRVAAAALVGGGAVLPAAASDAPAGVIHMAVGRGGYVGLVRLEDDRVDVAAALQAALVQEAGGLARAVERLLAHPCAAAAPHGIGVGRRDSGARLRGIGVGDSGVGRSVADKHVGLHLDRRALHAARWRGTPLLTRERAVAGERLFVVGDAAGYVEPFTGQGIAWALASGAAVAPLALDAARCWSADLADEWTRLHGDLLGGSRRRCARLTRALRVEPLVLAATAALRLAPWLARPMLSGLNRAAGMSRRWHAQSEPACPHAG